MSDVIRVVVADDQELVRSGFSALIANEPDLAVVGEAATGDEAVDVSVASAPDVVLMDIRMPTIDGIEATRRLRNDHRTSSTRVLILTTFEIDQYVHDALRAGASGFLLKDTSPPQLLDAIRVVHRGEGLLAPSVTRRLIEQFAQAPDPAAARETLAGLTDREKEVLAAVGRGLTNAEIGALLFISPLTAKTHVSRIMSKLLARDRAQLVVTAYETGLVVPGDSSDR